MCPSGQTHARELLRLFDLPAEAVRQLWRQKFDPTHRNVYRGWFPLQKGFPTAKEGIDIGADVAYGAGVVDLIRSTSRGDTAASGGSPARMARRGRRLLSRHGRAGQRSDVLGGARLGAAGAVLRPFLRARAVHAATDPLSACATISMRAAKCTPSSGSRTRASAVI